MDWGAWWAIIHGVAKSQTRPRDFTFTLVIYLNQDLSTSLWDQYLCQLFLPFFLEHRLGLPFPKEYFFPVIFPGRSQDLCSFKDGYVFIFLSGSEQSVSPPLFWTLLRSLKDILLFQTCLKSGTPRPRGRHCPSTKIDSTLHCVPSRPPERHSRALPLLTPPPASPPLPRFTVRLLFSHHSSLLSGSHAFSFLQVLRMWVPGSGMLFPPSFAH